MTRLIDRPAALTTLIVVQALCAAFFVWDVIEDLRPNGLRSLENIYIATETLAAIALILAVTFEIQYLRTLLRRKAHLEHQVSIAAGALHDVMLDHFDAWGLTPSECDVALFVIKGLSIQEIASARSSAEGTVKSQLNAVYKKAGVSGRGALIGLLIDDLLDAPILSASAAGQEDQKG